MDAICGLFADVVKGMAVQRDTGKSAPHVTQMVRDLLKGQDLDWSFPLFDEAVVDVYGRWQRLPPEQVRSVWHRWCMGIALTPEQPGR
jgi:hypothetical protein